jgi:hypothetical protein
MYPMHGWDDRARMDPPSWVMRLAWTLWMAFIVFVILGGFAVSSSAQPTASLVFRAQGNTGQPIALRLYDRPCEDAEVLKHLLTRVTPDFLAKFKAAKLTWEGKEWASCWILRGGMVYSIDSTGEKLQPLPMAVFRDEAV